MCQFLCVYVLLENKVLHKSYLSYFFDKYILNSRIIEEINCSVEGSRGKYSQWAELDLDKKSKPIDRTFVG